MLRPFLSVNFDASRFVEGDNVPERHEPALPGTQVHEHLRRRGLPARDEVAVWTELLVDEAFARASWPELDRVVVALDERNEPLEVVKPGASCSTGGSARSPSTASAGRATGRA